MLYVVGVGASYPSNSISGDQLKQWSKSARVGTTQSAVAQKESSIVERMTSLPAQYFQANFLEKHNFDPPEAQRCALESPTSLGAEACEEALSRAGVLKESVNLLIADTSTPYQTTPSEAQRIAGKLGVKIEAYDISTSIGTFALHCETLLAWRPGLVPEYVLSVSTNTPTQVIDYGAESSSDVANYLGDCGGAALLSVQHKGKLVVRDAVFGRAASASSAALKMRLFDPITMDEKARAGMNAEIVRRAAAAISTHRLPLDRTVLITSCLSSDDALAAAAKLGISADNLWCSVDRHGFSLGSQVYATLASGWSRLQAGMFVVTAEAGVGDVSGYVVLEVVSHA